MLFHDLQAKILESAGAFFVANKPRNQAASSSVQSARGASTAPKNEMQRRIEIDAARGLMLVWMTLTHMPTMLTPWVNQPFGYISASEGFIFLSALFTGFIYERLLERSGPGVMASKLLGRTLRLYQYHVALLFGAFLIAARFAVNGHHQALYYLLDFYFSAGRARAVTDALLLIYRPPLLDIIPLYLIFLLLSPLALLVADKLGWRILLACGFLIWFLAQFGLRQGLYGFATHHFHLAIPLSEMGAFNLWAWQFMWIIGLWCGARWAKGNLRVEAWAQRVWIPCGGVVAALLAVRYAEICGVVNLAPYAIVFDKWHLGALRLLDFACITAVLVRFQTLLRPLAVRPLVLLGQASLQVFVTHFVFCFIALGWIGSDPRLYGWKQFAMLGVTFAALLLVAKIFGKPDAPPATPTEQRASPAPPKLPAPVTETPGAS